MIYTIYEIPGHKNGATNDRIKRFRENFNKYQIEPILIETMEGPNTPEFWQVVGDREWELADLNGYPRGTHYRVAREKRPKWNDKTRHLPSKEACIAGGKWHKGKPKSARYHTKEHTAAATEASLLRIVCEHCGKDANTGNYTRWHGDNCKHKKTLTN